MAKFYLDRYFAKAEQVRFETPVYDYYEDEYGDEQRDCVREGTSKRSLCKQVQETNAPIYYFRRWNGRATDDKHYINHHYKDSCDVIAKKNHLTRHLKQSIIVLWTNRLKLY